MDAAELEHLTAMLNTYLKRLRILELQQAKHGRDTAPQIPLEIEDVRAHIARLQQWLAMPKDNTAYSVTVQIRITDARNFSQDLLDAGIRAFLAVANTKQNVVTLSDVTVAYGQALEPRYLEVEAVLSPNAEEQWSNIRDEQKNLERV